MQTQGVSLVSAGLKNSGTSHATKVNDATFDSFMSNHAQKVKLHEQPEVVQTSKSRPENKDFLEISRKTTSGQTTGSFSKETVYGQSMTEQNVSVRSPKDEVVVEEVDVNALPKSEFANSSLCRDALVEIREKQKDMIRNNEAVVGNKNWTVDGSKIKGKKMIEEAIKLNLKTFNNGCDYIINTYLFQ